MSKTKKNLKLAKALRFQIGSDGNLYASVSNSQGSFFVAPEVLSFLCLIGNEKGKNLPNTREWNQLLEELIGAGLVIDDMDNKGHLQPEDGFADSWIQWAMISDHTRCLAYEKAIKKSVNPDSHVLDVGAGCGFLSASALSAGAKKITAIEETKSALAIHPILEKIDPKFKNKITIENKNSFDAKITPDISLVISELFGNDPFSEGVIPTLKNIAARFQNKQPEYIPQKMTVYFEFCEVVEHPVLHRLSAFQNEEEKQKDLFSKFLNSAKKILDLDKVSFPLAIDAQNLKRISQPLSLGSTPLNPPQKTVKKDFTQKKSLKLNQQSNQTTIGLIWFRVHLTPELTISSHPQESDACQHWSPIAIALNQQIFKEDLLEIKSSLDDFENFIAVDVFCNKKKIGSR